MTEVKQMETKKLNLAALKNEVSRFGYNDTKKVLLGEGYHLHVHPNFSDSRLDKAVLAYFKDIDDAHKAKISLASEGNGSAVMFLELIFEFTDITKVKDFKKKLEVMSLLHDTGYFAKIIAEFSKESIDKTTNKVNALAKEITRLGGLAKKQQEEFLKTLNK
ncbi:hypothetical protein ACI2JA_19635 [Alkalihalobacillus sp. NPDC078783]|uniref:hypothetical protein n=1 Tax=Streptomyces albidoflavus TaxID=1886 RepID=UPI0034092552